MKELKGIAFVLLIGLPVMLIVWIYSLYSFGCISDNSCTGAHTVERTSIPTLIPGTMPAPKVGADVVPVGPKCQITAVEFIGFWVNAGSPESDAFEFVDAMGKNCTASYEADVQKLFTESNLWYDGAPACTTCHYADVVKANMNLDMSSYAGVLAGSGRVNGEPTGKDILGGGVWETSLLYQMLYAPNGESTIGRLIMPLGRSATVPANGPMLFVGSPIEAVETTAP